MTKFCCARQIGRSLKPEGVWLFEGDEIRMEGGPGKRSYYCV